MKKIFFRSIDGLSLCAVWHVPKEKTSKAIILAHGITVDKDENGLFARLADSLERNGYAVFRFDFRGHGESGGKSIDMTIDGEVLDLEASLREVKSKGYSEIGLLGASFGGGVSALYVSEHQESIKCLCLWNPVLNYDHTFLNPTVPWIKDKREYMMKEIQEKGWTTLGSRKFVIGKALFDDMAKLYPFMVLKNITIPTVIIHGTKDTKVPYEDSKEYVTSLKKGTFITFDGAEHGFHDNEEADKAIEATIKFFQKNL